MAGGDDIFLNLCHKFYLNHVRDFFPERKCDMIHKRKQHSLCTDGRFLFASGSAKEHVGIDKNLILDDCSVEKYDPINDIWSVIPSLQVGRSNHSSFCLDDKLYVFAG